MRASTDTPPDSTKVSITRELTIELQQIDRRLLGVMQDAYDALDLGKAVLGGVAGITVRLNPDALEARADEFYSVTVRRLELIRNVFTLLPLLVTWISLTLAAINYGHIAANHDVKFDRSFLELWQASFDDKSIIWSPSFSETGFTDVFLLICVAGISWWLQRAENQARQQTQLFRALYDTQLQDLLGRVERWHASDSDRRFRSALEASADRMTDASITASQASEVLARDAALWSKDVVRFGEVTTRLDTWSTNVSELTNLLRDVSSTIGRSADALASSVGTLSGLRADFAESVSGLVTRVSRVADATDEIRDVHDQLRDSLRRIVEAVTAHTEVSRQIMDAQLTLGKAFQDRLDTVVDALPDADAIAAEIRSGWAEAQQSQRVAILEQLRPFFASWSESVSEQVASLDGAGVGLRSGVEALAVAATAIGGLRVTMATDLGLLVSRTEEVTGATVKLVHAQDLVRERLVEVSTAMSEQVSRVGDLQSSQAEADRLYRAKIDEVIGRLPDHVAIADEVANAWARAQVAQIRNLREEMDPIFESARIVSQQLHAPVARLDAAMQRVEKLGEALTDQITYFLGKSSGSDDPAGASSTRESGAEDLLRRVVGERPLR